MLMPHELFLPFMAATATLAVLMTSSVMFSTFIGLLIRGTIRRRLTAAWDFVAHRFRNPRRKIMVSVWRDYCRVIDVVMNRQVCAAFHRVRARHAWFKSLRQLHERVAARLESDKFTESELRIIGFFAGYPNPFLVEIARYMSLHVARQKVPPEKFLAFLLQEQAAVKLDPEAFRGHTRRLKERFGISPFHGLAYLDEVDETQ